MAVPAKPKAPKYLMTRDGTCYAFNLEMAKHVDLYVGVDSVPKNAGPKLWDRLAEEQEQARIKRKQALNEAAAKRAQNYVLATKDDQDPDPYDVSDVAPPPEPDEGGVEIDDPEDEIQDDDPDDTKVDEWSVPPQDDLPPKSSRKR